MYVCIMYTCVYAYITHTIQCILFRGRVSHQAINIFLQIKRNVPPIIQVTPPFAPSRPLEKGVPLVIGIFSYYQTLIFLEYIPFMGVEVCVQRMAYDAKVSSSPILLCATNGLSCKRILFPHSTVCNQWLMMQMYPLPPLNCVQPMAYDANVSSSPIKLCATNGL
jgi:hypothetical protein